MSDRSWDNPWPERVDTPDARSILMEFVATCGSHDLGLLYATAAKKPIALTWEGRDYLVYAPDGEDWASLERAKRERASFEPLMLACKRVSAVFDREFFCSAEQADSMTALDRAISQAEGRVE